MVPPALRPGPGHGGRYDEALGVYRTLSRIDSHNQRFYSVPSGALRAGAAPVLGHCRARLRGAAARPHPAPSRPPNDGCWWCHAAVRQGGHRSRSLVAAAPYQIENRMILGELYGMQGPRFAGRGAVRCGPAHRLDRRGGPGRRGRIPQPPPQLPRIPPAHAAALRIGRHIARTQGRAVRAHDLRRAVLPASTTSSSTNWPRCWPSSTPTTRGSWGSTAATSSPRASWTGRSELFKLHTADRPPVATTSRW